MKRLAAAVLLAALALSPGAALADQSQVSFRQVLSVINGGVTIPPEWEGVWVSQDSVYDCNGVFQRTTTVTDTLCADQVITDPGTFPFTLDCTGTATTTSFNETCTGNGIVGGCTVDFFFNTHGTRTGDSFYIVSTNSSNISGGGICDVVPDPCSQTNSHSTRTGPAPPGACTTPTWQPTWGEMKVHYR